MKKLVLLSLAAVALAAPAFAADTTPAAPAGAMTAKPMAAKKIELKDGSWAKVSASGTVKVSKDGGKTWETATKGTWEAKDGTSITTDNNGKQVKM